MKEFLLEILCDPTSGQPLIYDKEKNILRTENTGVVYHISEEAPVILIKNASAASTPLHNNVNTDFDYAGHYQKDAEVFDYFNEGDTSATRMELKRLHSAIAESIPSDAKLILDVGCGNGWLAGILVKKNKQVISMDISATNPVKALQNYPGQNHAALVADVFQLPIKDNSIDCIVASEIMEHVHDPKLFVKKLVEKLKPGGKLIIATPYNEKIEYYLCVHCNLPTPKNAHLHSFNKENIPAILADDNIDWKAKATANKFLIRTRMNVLLRFLPFRLWKTVDAAMNKIIKSPTRFIIEIIKK